MITLLALAGGYNKGCIKDNGVTDSSILAGQGYKTGGEPYRPEIGGGQTSEWKSTGYRSDGDAFLIYVSGKTYSTSLYDIDPNIVPRCRICAKPKKAMEHKFKLRPNHPDYDRRPEEDEPHRHYISSDYRDDNDKNDVDVVDNCLCTKIEGVDGITADNLNDNDGLDHIRIRQEPQRIEAKDVEYCQESMQRFDSVSNRCNGVIRGGTVTFCSEFEFGYRNENDDQNAGIDWEICEVPLIYSANDYSNIKAISNWTCTDQFYYDANDNSTYDGDSEDIVYNNPDLRYINLDHWKRDGNRKYNHEMDCYYDAGLGAVIGLFGANGQDKPSTTYQLYSEFYDREQGHYRYRSPNNQIFPTHLSGEKISLIYNDGYYDDNTGYYTINFIEGIATNNFGGILSNIVQTVENLYIGDGYLKESFKRIVQNTIFQFLVKFTLIFYLSFSALGIITGAVEISRKEFFGRILKISFILFFTNPDSWLWYNDIVVQFFMGAITTLNELTLNLSFVDKNPLITDTEVKFGASDGHAQKFAFPDQMIMAFFTENVFIKLWSLLFSDFFLAGIFIIVGIYGLMFYFVYIMAIVVLNYLTAITIVVTLIAIGPIVFLFSISKSTIVFFNRWLVYMSSRIMEITMLFLLLYVFLSEINDKIGLYQSLNPDSLLYFESCPHNLYDLMSDAMSSAADKVSTPLGSLDEINDSVNNNPVSEHMGLFLKTIFTPFTIYVATPTKGIQVEGSGFVGGKDFFEMISIIMEVFVLLYFMNMIMGQVGLMAAAIISYQQQNASIFSGARGVAAEGEKILGLAQKNVLSGIKFAGGEFYKAGSFANKAGSFAFRKASNVMKYYNVSDALSKVSVLKTPISVLKTPIIARSNFYDAKAEKTARSYINIVEKNKRNKVISSEGLEDKISEESIKKIRNNQIDKKTRDELNSVGVDSEYLESKLKISDNELKSSVMKKIMETMPNKSDIAIREINKHLIKQEITEELNNLKQQKEDGELLTAPEAYKELTDKLSSKAAEKYDGINFSESLREVLNKNLTDKEVLENANKIQSNRIKELISQEEPGFNINNNKDYDRLQKALKQDKAYQSLQSQIQEHLSFNENINRSVGVRKKIRSAVNSARKSPVQSFVGGITAGINSAKKNPVKSITAIIVGVPLVLAAPVTVLFIVPIVAVSYGTYSCRYEIQRSGYKFVTKLGGKIFRRRSYNTMFDPIHNTFYKVTFQDSSKAQKEDKDLMTLKVILEDVERSRADLEKEKDEIEERIKAEQIKAEQIKKEDLSKQIELKDHPKIKPLQEKHDKAEKRLQDILKYDDKYNDDYIQSLKDKHDELLQDPVSLDTHKIKSLEYVIQRIREEKNKC